MEDYSQLDVSLEGDVLRIAFDRPEKRNAINGAVSDELARVFRDTQGTDARVVVLTGNGEAFSAGGDLEWLQERVSDPPYSVHNPETIIKDMLNLDRPIIARLNGDTIGLGATLALFCDIAIASEDARIGDPHINAGLAAGDGGAVIWPLLTSMNKAKELLMTGKLLSAEEAVELGLINYAVPSDELDETVDEMIDELASGPQTAIRYTKLALNTWLEQGVNSVLRQSLALERLSQRHPDHEEAVDAFLNRREPKFPSGRKSDE